MPRAHIEKPLGIRWRVTTNVQESVIVVMIAGTLTIQVPKVYVTKASAKPGTMEAEDQIRIEQSEPDPAAVAFAAKRWAGKTEEERRAMGKMLAEARARAREKRVKN